MSKKMEHQIDETGEFTEDDYNNLLKSDTMTTEEMNRIIAGYMGYRLLNNGGVMKMGENPIHPSELRYHFCWNAIHDVWQKLRGELEAFIKNKYKSCNDIDEYEYNISMGRWAYRTVVGVQKAIAQDTDLPTAHRLIVEAITLIKK